MSFLDKIQAENSFCAFQKKFITELYSLELEASEKLEDLINMGLDPEPKEFIKKYSKAKLVNNYGEDFVSINYRQAIKFLKKIGVK